MCTAAHGPLGSQLALAHPVQDIAAGLLRLLPVRRYTQLQSLPVAHCSTLSGQRLALQQKPSPLLDGVQSVPALKHGMRKNRRFLTSAVIDSYAQ